jgi:hypothetical protein
MAAVPINLTLTSSSPSTSTCPAANVLDLDLSTCWQADGRHGRVELELRPPSALHSLLLHNAGASEVAIYACNKATTEFDRRGFMGPRPPRPGYAEQGDVVELLPRSRPFSGMARGCAMLRVGRGEGRLRIVAAAQSWSHMYAA